MGSSGRFTHVGIILDCWDRYMQVLYLGRALRTKKTLPDFQKWCRVTRHPLVFHGLTGSQRTPGFWGVTVIPLFGKKKPEIINFHPYVLCNSRKNIIYVKPEKTINFQKW